MTAPRSSRRPSACTTRSNVRSRIRTAAPWTWPTLRRPTTEALDRPERNPEGGRTSRKEALEQRQRPLAPARSLGCQAGPAQPDGQSSSRLVPAVDDAGRRVRPRRDNRALLRAAAVLTSGTPNRDCPLAPKCFHDRPSVPGQRGPHSDQTQHTDSSHERHPTIIPEPNLRRWSRPAWPLGQCFARQTKTIPRAPNLRGGLALFAQSGSERDALNPDRGSASRSEASRTHSAHVGSLRGKGRAARTRGGARSSAFAATSPGPRQPGRWIR